MKILMFSFVFIFVLNFTATAESFTFEKGEDEDYYADTIESFGVNDLIESTPKEVDEVIDEFELDFSKPESFVEVLSFDGMKSIFDSCVERINFPKKLILTLSATIIILMLAISFSDQRLNSNFSLQILCTLFSSLLIIYPTLTLLRSCVSVIQTISNFMLIFIPIFSGVLIAALKTSVASAYSTTMFFVCEGVSWISSSFILPMLNCFLALSIGGNVTDDNKLSSIASVFKKVIYVVISIVMSVFLIVLSVQNIVTSSIDNTFTKTSKIFISYIPIIGPALSESLGSLRGCVDLLKSTSGIYAIVVMIVVVLPMIIEILVYKLSFFLCEQISNIYSVSRISKLLSAVNSVLTIGLSLVLCVVVMFIFSITIIFVFGSSI